MPKFFTRSGDKGETGRFDGIRVAKNDPLIEAHGVVDECNSLVGVARSFVQEEGLGADLRRIQCQLIVVGAMLTNVGRDQRLPSIDQRDLSALEELIERLQTELPPLKNLILPAGGKAAAHLHLARTAARKVERRLMTLRETTEVEAVLHAFFNRLADALYVLARYAAMKAGHPDEVWNHSVSEGCQPQA